MGISALTSDGEHLSYFAGAGVIIEGFGPLSALPVVAYSTDQNFNSGTAHGIIQTTLDLGRFVVDPRYHLTIPIHGNTNNPTQHMFGLTLSLGNPQARIGLNGNYNPNTNNRPLTDLLVRYDVDAQDHSSWLEASVGETGAQFQWRGNF